MNKGTLTQLFAITTLCCALVVISYLYYQELKVADMPDTKQHTRLQPESDLPISAPRQQLKEAVTTKVQQAEQKRTQTETTGKEAPVEAPKEQSKPLINKELAEKTEVISAEKTAAKHDATMNKAETTRSASTSLAEANQKGQGKNGTSSSTIAQGTVRKSEMEKAGAPNKQSTGSSSSKLKEPITLSSAERFAVPAFSASLSSLHVIDPYADTLLLTSQGLLLFVPANSFMGQAGELPGAHIQVAIQELRSNAASLHQYYRLSVRDGQRDLTLKPNRALFIELPTRELSGAQVRLIAQELDGKSPMHAQSKTPYVLCLPLKALGFGNMATDTTHQELQASLNSLEGSVYQNTVVSTREFKNRVKALLALQADAIEFLSIYTQNPNKSLSSLDSLAVQLLYNRSIVADSPQREQYESLHQTFLAFQNLNQGAPLPYAFAGVNLASPKAAYQLTQQGLTPADASWLHTLYKANQSITQHLAQSEVGSGLRLGYQLTTTGWLSLQTTTADSPLPFASLANTANY